MSWSSEYHTEITELRADGVPHPIALQVTLIRTDTREYTSEIDSVTTRSTEEVITTVVQSWRLEVKP